MDYLCPSQVNVKTLTVHKILNLWHNTSTYRDRNDNQCDKTEYRHLYPLESAALFFEVSLRHKKSMAMNPHQLQTYLRTFTIPKNLYTHKDDEWKSILYSCPDSYNFHSCLAQIAGNIPCFMTNLISVYDATCTNVRMSLTASREILLSTMHDTRQKLKRYPLFCSLSLKKYTETNISTIPENLSDYTAVKQWSDERATVLRTHLSESAVTDYILKNVQVFTSSDLFRLYGNLRGHIALIMDKIGQTPNIPQTLYYKIEQLGLLTKKRSSLPLAYSGTSRDTSHLHKPMPPLQERLIEAAEGRCPIWGTTLPSGAMNFMRLIPLQERKRPAENNSVGTMDELIERFVYPKTESGMKFKNNEFVQSAMHWSTFLADVDIFLSQKGPPVHHSKVACDVATLSGSLFQRLFHKTPKGIHVFWSADDEPNPIKIGLHLHMVLPPGMVFTSQSCRSFANLLEILRLHHPETLGLDTKENKPIFDLNIYPVDGIGKCPRGHCIRGPGQFKRDGTHPLVLLHTQGAPLDIHCMLAHGAQMNDDKQRVLQGTIVHNITDFEDIRDEIFVKNHVAHIMSQNMYNVCKTTTQDIMEEINKKFYLFHYKDELDVQKLLETLNSLWRESRGRIEMVNHIKNAIGTDGVSFPSYAAQLMERTYFVHEPKLDAILLSTGKSTKFPFCPIRPHRSIGASVNISVGYNTKMIRFPMFVSGCFKSSCKKTTQDKQFMPQVVPSTPGVYISKQILTDMSEFIKKHCMGTRVHLVRLDEDVDDWEEESKSYVTLHIVHGGEGLAHCIQGRPLCEFIKNPHMFIFRENIIGCMLFTSTDNDVYLCAIMGRDTYMAYGKEKAYVLQYARDEELLNPDIVEKAEKYLQ